MTKACFALLNVRVLIQCQLQLRRTDFDMPSPTSMQESSASLLTQMVQLNAILVEIQTLNQLAASQPFHDPTFTEPDR